MSIEDEGKKKSTLMSLGKGNAKAKNPEAHKAVNTSQKRLNVNIDSDLHARFKSTVSRKGSDMTETLETLITQWLRENE